MANGLVSLGYLRMQAQQRSDTENNPAISITEWNQYLSSSYKELYDMIVAAYGNDYYCGLPYTFPLTGGQFYGLPDGSINYLINGQPAPAFYKLLGVDLQYSASPTGWVTLGNFELIERNKFQVPNTSTNFLAYTNLKYRLAGNQLWYSPIPSAGQLSRIFYVPEPTSLIFAPSCALTATNAMVGVSDATSLIPGMSLYYPSAFPAGATILSVNTTNNTIVVSAAPTLTVPVAIIPFWIDSATLDGVSGWEEYVIVDAAIKAKDKLEFPTDVLERQKEKMTKRVESMAEGRDAGQAHHVADALAVNGYDGSGFNDGMGGMGGMGGI